MTLPTKYLDSVPFGFRQNDFFMFSYLAYVNHVTPGAGRILAPGANYSQMWERSIK